MSSKLRAGGELKQQNRHLLQRKYELPAARQNQQVSKPAPQKQKVDNRACVQNPTTEE